MNKPRKEEYATDAPRKKDGWLEHFNSLKREGGKLGEEKAAIPLGIR